jgi:sialate O-acetylesterase
LFRRSKVLLSVCSALLFLPCVHAEVTLPSLFADGMVLQRDMPIHVWGQASPAEAISVTFRSETKSTTADELGRWRLYLSSSSAGGPFQLNIRGTNALTIKNVLVGDVWIASGQSNMEFPIRLLADAKAEIANAKFPQIRFLRVQRSFSEYPLDNAALDQPWSECSPETVSELSAVAYYFAREIHERQKVPIGIIQSAWGGTVAEAWTSLSALSSDAALMPVFASRARMMESWSEDLLKEKKYQADLAKARADGTPPPPEFPWHPNPPMWEPSALFNAMIAPLTLFSIRGVIWYQGETNSKLDRAPSYERVFQTLIRDWRNHWAQGDFPFLFTQISSFTSTPEEDWATIREAQRCSLILNNTAMAVTIDIGDPNDVHPKNKREVGHRLALAARARTYGEAVEFSGPLFRRATIEGITVRAWFDHAEGLHTNAGPATGFEIAGEDGKFVPAEARIDGSTALISSNNVAAPRFVRYGWANNPACNLFNSAGLPASPFQSGK